MTTAETNPPATGTDAGTGGKLITQNMIEQFLYREARYLDDREFEKWLDCYADDVVYWMPSWDDNDRLTEDPQREISLIYYGNKGGSRTGCSGFVPRGPRRPRFPNRGRATTSAMSR